MRVTPMRDCIFVLPDKAIEATESGIIFTDYTRKRQNTGVIISLGPKVKSPEIHEGRRVLYGTFSGERELIEWNGKEVELFLMTETDIIGVLDEEETHSNNSSVQ